VHSACRLFQHNEARDSFYITATQQHAQAPPLDTEFASALHLRIYPKIAAALKTDDAAIKVQALTRLCLAFANKAEEVVHATDGGVFEPLYSNLTAADVRVRQLAAEAMCLFTAPRYGREHVVAAARTATFVALLSDADVEVRRTACAILLNLVRGCTQGRAALIKEGGVAVLLAKADGDDDVEVKARLLDALGECLRDDVAFGQALKTGVVDTLSKLAAHATPAVRTAACSCAARCGERDVGKTELVQAGVVPLLIRLLSDASDSVREHASRALMNVTICEVGKMDAVVCGAVPACIKRVTDTTDVVVANCLQTLGNVAVYPDSRQGDLLDGEKTLKLIKAVRDASKSELVKRAANDCLAHIEWRP
jgi:hypothetical protein